MKSLPFFSLLLLTPLILSAQPEPDSVEVFCVIASHYRIYAKDFTTVDYGHKITQKKSQTRQDKLEADEDQVNFGSMVEAMNYLSARGWVYVEMYGVALADAALVNYCLMRKRVAFNEINKN